MTIPIRTIPQTEFDLAMDTFFSQFEGNEVRVSVVVDGKRVGTWTERRKLTEQDAQALRQTLEGE